MRLAMVDPNDLGGAKALSQAKSAFAITTAHSDCRARFEDRWVGGAGQTVAANP